MVGVTVSVATACLVIGWAAAAPSSDKSTGGGGFKPRDVKSGEYPDYDKYVDLPEEESLEQTLWRRVLRDPKTRRPTKPMTKRRARMMRWRKRYLKEREERFAEEDRLALLSTPNSPVEPEEINATSEAPTSTPSDESKSSEW